MPDETISEDKKTFEVEVNGELKKYAVRVTTVD